MNPPPAISIQETDGSYFETFTSLAWKRENRRLSSMRAAEARAEIIPDNEREPTTDEDQQQQQLQHPEQKEQLYVDVLYTIANTVGQPGSQVSMVVVGACEPIRGGHAGIGNQRRPRYICLTKRDCDYR